jgi:predicted aspartyl protease
MLTRDGAAFTTSRSTYHDFDLAHTSRRTGAIYVQRELPTAPRVFLYALVDTGAPYCLFDTQWIETLQLRREDGESISLRTPYGLYAGTIHRLPIRVVAEEGQSLEVDASVFVTDDHWQHGNFLGYSGFLERLRFAVDPDNNSWYFGPREP